jgi:hypothetical protein
MRTAAGILPRQTAHSRRGRDRQVAPVAAAVPAQERHGCLAGAGERVEGSWCGNDSPERKSGAWKSRSADVDLRCQREMLTPLVIARILENRHRNYAPRHSRCLAIFKDNQREHIHPTHDVF